MSILNGHCISYSFGAPRKTVLIVKFCPMWYVWVCDVHNKRSFSIPLLARGFAFKQPERYICNIVYTIPPVYFIIKVLLNKLTVEQNFISLNIDGTTDLKQNCCSPTFVIFYIYISVENTEKHLICIKVLLEWFWEMLHTNTIILEIPETFVKKKTRTTFDDNKL